MELLIQKLSDVKSKELSKPGEKNRFNDFEALLEDLRNTGVIKKPSYNLPLVDTIGKTYYSAINRRTNNPHQG